MGSRTAPGKSRRRMHVEMRDADALVDTKLDEAQTRRSSRQAGVMGAGIGPLAGSGTGRAGEEVSTA